MIPSPFRQRGTPMILSTSGFTLIELLITMAIASIVLAGTASVYTALTRSYTTETVRADTQQNIRSAMALMVQDIRLGFLDPLGTAGGSISEPSPNAIKIIADLDYDGAFTPGINEVIDYFLNGNQLVQRLDNDPNTDAVLVANVTALNFTYDDPADPTTVVINLTIVAPAGRDGTVTRTLTERVRIRNQ